MAAIYKNKEKKLGILLQPLQDLPDSQKDQEWYKDNTTYFYDKYTRGECGLTESEIAEIGVNRTYAKGQQSWKQYIPILIETLEPESATVAGDDDSIFNQQLNNITAREGWMNINFKEILSVAPKFVHKILGIFKDQNHEVTAEAIDRNSRQEKKQKKNIEILKFRNQDKINELNQKLGIRPEESRFETVQQIDIYEQMGGFKPLYETGLEMLLRHTSNISDIESIKEKIIEDLIIGNYAAAMNYTDDVLQIEKYQYTDPVKVAIEYSDEDDFKKSRFAFYQVDLTVEELMMFPEFADWTEEKIRALALQYIEYNGYKQSEWDAMIYSESSTLGYRRFRIPCTLNFWKGIKRKDNEDDYVEIKGKVRKSEIESEKIIERKGKTYKRIDKKEIVKIQAVHKAYWIIGTNHVFGCGYLNDAPFNYYEKDLSLPISAYKIKGRSIMSLWRPLLDNIQITFLKLQNDIAISGPSNKLAIDYNAIQEITYGNRRMKEDEIIALGTQRGIILYKGATTHGQMGALNEGGHFNQDPIKELRGGYGAAVTDAVVSFEMNFNLMSEIGGIDRVSAIAGFQQKDKSATEVKIASAGTTDTLKIIYSGWVNIYKNLSENASLKIPLLIYFNKDENIGYYGVVDDIYLDALKEAYGFPPKKFGIVVEPSPTYEERMMLLNSAKEALAANTIPMSDYTMITHMLLTMESLKKVMAYLAFKEAQKKEKDDKSQKDIVLAQKEGEIAVMNAKLKEIEAERKAEADAEIRVVRAKGEEERKTLTLKIGLENKVTEPVS